MKIFLTDKIQRLSILSSCLLYASKALSIYDIMDCMKWLSGQFECLAHMPLLELHRLHRLESQLLSTSPLKLSGVLFESFFPVFASFSPTISLPSNNMLLVGIGTFCSLALAVVNAAPLATPPQSALPTPSLQVDKFENCDVRGKYFSVG